MRISKWMALPAALVAAAALSVNTEAAPKANKASAPKTTKTTKTTTTSSPKGKMTSSGEVSKAKGPKTKSTTTTTAKNSGSTKKSSASTKKNASATTTTETTPTTTTTGTGTGTTWEPTNPVAEKLMGKPNQLAKAKAVIGDTTDINLATEGFKNFGQFNAAVNASQNLGIDFADLKASMTGITLEGEKTNLPTKSLGQSIKQYRPGVDADAEAAIATSQAAQ